MNILGLKCLTKPQHVSPTDETAACEGTLDECQPVARHGCGVSGNDEAIEESARRSNAIDRVEVASRAQLTDADTQYDKRSDAASGRTRRWPCASTPISKRPSCGCSASKPVPYPYAVLLHQTIYIYCFLLPFGLVHAIVAATPVMAVFVTYTLFALEAIA